MAVFFLGAPSFLGSMTVRPTALLVTARCSSANRYIFTSKNAGVMLPERFDVPLM
jgi:hypothetical protein